MEQKVSGFSIIWNPKTTKKVSFSKKVFLNESLQLYYARSPNQRTGDLFLPLKHII